MVRPPSGAPAANVPITGRLVLAAIALPTLLWLAVTTSPRALIRRLPTRVRWLIAVVVALGAGVGLIAGELSWFLAIALQVPLVYKLAERAYGRTRRSA